MGNMWTASTAVIDNHIRQHCVVMYSTTICSYCTKTKQLLSELNIDCDVVELNLLSPSDGGHVSQDLIKKTNVRTVGVSCSDNVVEILLSLHRKRVCDRFMHIRSDLFGVKSKSDFLEVFLTRPVSATHFFGPRP